MNLFPNSLQYELSSQLAACQAQSRRNGKVARLPFALRQQINQMLDDGVPYKVIIQKLGPAGRHLNETNLTNWRQGGYQDHLKIQALYGRAVAQTEAAANLVREGWLPDASKIGEACSQVALLQYLESVKHYGDELVHHALTKNPAKFITLMNALSNMSHVHLATKKLELKLPTPPAPAAHSAQSSSVEPVT